MKEENKRKKPSILWYGDFCAWTGFATVGENLVKGLKDEFDITVLATNYFGEPHDWDLKIIPAIKFSSADPQYQDANGQKRLIDELIVGNYDILFTQKDAINMTLNNFAKNIKLVQKELQNRGKKVFKWVLYAALDANPRRNWVEDAVMLADYPITYTSWAKKEMQKIKPSLDIRVIPLGIDIETFKPLPRAEKRRMKKDLEKAGFKDRFIVTNINRNMVRKNIPGTLLAFKLFKEKVPNALLWLHMGYKDLGGNFIEMAQDLGLVVGKDFFFPPDLAPDNMPTPQQVNEIYNWSDMVISTTFGEGWGFSLTEAMAAKIPIIAPNNTSCTEIVENKRGYLVDIDDNYNLWSNRGNEYFNIWCQGVNVYKFADTMYECYRNKEETTKRVEAGYEWVQKLKWDILVKAWEKLFREILQ